jgi:hypothetical protein
MTNVGLTGRRTQERPRRFVVAVCRLNGDDGGSGTMSNAYVEILRDATLRLEIGPAAAAALAVENVELQTGARSRAVRSSVIVRRADGPILSANQLTMGDVRLPDPVVPVLRPCAA